jgi:hypothetical protein
LSQFSWKITLCRRANITDVLLSCGPGSSVGIATAYGLDGPGFETRCRRIILTCPDRPWSPPSLPFNEYRVFPYGKERPGRDADFSPPSSVMELYLYFPYGPYGVYRTSVPIQGCTVFLLEDISTAVHTNVSNCLVLPIWQHRVS